MVFRILLSGVSEDLISSEQWISAVDLCTEEVAQDLLTRAERTYPTAERFLKILEGRYLESADASGSSMVVAGER